VSVCSEDLSAAASAHAASWLGLVDELDWLVDELDWAPDELGWVVAGLQAVTTKRSAAAASTIRPG
jgi:hypothetical protein